MQDMLGTGSAPWDACEEKGFHEMTQAINLGEEEQVSPTPIPYMESAAPRTAATDAAEPSGEEPSTEQVRAYINALPYAYHKKPIYGFFKRLADLIFSGLLLLVIWPVYIIIALLIKCSDGGSVFYRHQRVGQGGKTIYVHKFRSMKRNADQLADMLTPEQLQQYYTEFKIDNDPRITKIGRFLRKTSLDELPQVWDVFIGKLSLIGPRPLVEEETYLYFDKRDDLLSVKPGLTGYWQAYARNDVGYAEGQRQKMELYYVQNRSLWLDIKSFFKTISTVLRGKGAQ
jgi:lipopolysaccharide/colanic/teichoic acid biosynthesis glycosyltransferase